MSKWNELMIDESFIWSEIKDKVRTLNEVDPPAFDFINSISEQAFDFSSGLSLVVSYYLFSQDNIKSDSFLCMIKETLDKNPYICESASVDLLAFCNRNPACSDALQTFFFTKGYIALQSYRIAHALWLQGDKYSAQMIQMKMSTVFSVDIHPAASLGKGLFLDHATGLVIGETAVIEDNVSILHEVTLGGTGKQKGIRHPKIREGALLCAGAKILGNIEVGKGSKVGAGSVVLKDVPPKTTVVGVPARVVGALKESPAFEMDQNLN